MCNCILCRIGLPHGTPIDPAVAAAVEKVLDADAVLWDDMNEALTEAGVPQDGAKCSDSVRWLGRTIIARIAERDEEATRAAGLVEAQRCVTCRGTICPPMQCGYCIERSAPVPGMHARPATETLRLRVAALVEENRRLTVALEGIRTDLFSWGSDIQAYLGPIIDRALASPASPEPVRRCPKCGSPPLGDRGTETLCEACNEWTPAATWTAPFAHCSACRRKFTTARDVPDEWQCSCGGLVVATASGEREEAKPLADLCHKHILAHLHGEPCPACAEDATPPRSPALDRFGTDDALDDRISGLLAARDAGAREEPLSEDSPPSPAPSPHSRPCHDPRCDAPEIDESPSPAPTAAPIGPHTTVPQFGHICDERCAAPCLLNPYTPTTLAPFAVGDEVRVEDGLGTIVGRPFESASGGGFTIGGLYFDIDGKGPLPAKVWRIAPADLARLQAMARDKVAASTAPSRVTLAPFGKPDPKDSRTRGMLVVLVDGVGVGCLQRVDGGYIFVDGPSGAEIGKPGLTEGGQPYRDVAEARAALANFVVTDGHRAESPTQGGNENMSTESATAADRFNAADFYSCDGGDEELSHVTVEEAIAGWLEKWFTLDCDVAAFIREHGPVEVYAYERDDGPTDAWIRKRAEYSVEHSCDAWAEEFGSPDGDHFTPQLVEAATQATVELLRNLYSGVEVWRCEIVDKRTYGVGEVEALMRAHEPSWFEPIAKGVPNGR